MIENEELEFKSSFNDSVIESISAFANTNGGRILIGVDDNGKSIKNFIIGKESVQNWLNEIKNKTQPSIIPDVNILNIKGYDVVEIIISEFPIKPIAFRGRYYKRIKNSNHLLSVIEIANLSLQSLQVSWDSYVKQGFNIDLLDSGKIDRFIRRVNENGRFELIGDNLECLSKLKLLNNGQVTNAAYLLFSKDDIEYSVHIGRFKTDTFIIDDKIIKNSLFEAVEQTMKYIMSQIKVAFEITGKTTQRTEIFEYPLPALRELVLNSIVHRDYLSPIDIQIKIYDNRILFYNPGKLYGDLTIEDLKTNNYHANTRNRLIAEAFYLTGDIEKYGSGFRRIREEIANYPTMSLIFNEVPNGFEIELNYIEQKIITNIERDLERDLEFLNDTQIKILKLIADNPRITQKRLSEIVEINDRNIRKYINELKKIGIIKREGGDRGGYWKVISKK